MLTKYFLTLKKFLLRLENIFPTLKKYLLRLEKKFQDKNINIKIQL